MMNPQGGSHGRRASRCRAASPASRSASSAAKRASAPPTPKQLRRLLGQQKIDTKELDEILKGLRKLDDESAYANPRDRRRASSSR